MQLNISNKYKKHFIFILILIFILAIIPLYLIAFYSHPSVDDYYYGAETSGIWQNTDSLIAVVKCAYNMMKETYYTWQGNFLAIFLMRLQPSIFGENMYCLTPFILLTTFIMAFITFIYISFKKLLNAEKLIAFGIAISITICALEFCYCPVDSFYWFNGGIYYTFFFSLNLFLMVLLIYEIKIKENKLKYVLSIIGSVILAFLIGGGNYPTALSSLVLLFCLICLFILLKNKQAIYPVLFSFVAMLISFTISVIAPGNLIRQAATGKSIGIIKALIYSFAYAGYTLSDGLKVPVLILWLALLPLFYRLSNNLNVKFRLPLFVFLITFCIYASQGTALFYAQGLHVPPRVSNIIYFSSYLFIAFNLIYFCGWLKTRFPGNLLEKITNKLTLSEKIFSRFIIVCSIFFIIGCIGMCKVSQGDDDKLKFDLEPLSVNATYSLISGEAKQYSEEMNDRADYLSSLPQGSEVTIKPLSIYPKSLVHSDITCDPSNFKNDHLSEYYHLKSVSLVQDSVQNFKD